MYNRTMASIVKKEKILELWVLTIITKCFIISLDRRDVQSTPAYALRRLTCAACEGDIQPGDRAIRQTSWKRNSWHSTNWLHLKCYVEELEFWYEKNPYEAAIKPTKHSLGLSAEQLSARNRILKKHAVLASRRRVVLEGQNPEMSNLEKQRAAMKLDKYALKELEMAEKLYSLGGAPKSWGLDGRNSGQV